MSSEIFCKYIIFAHVWSEMSNFHPLEVVGCGSETQLRVGENLNKDNLEGKGLTK